MKRIFLFALLVWGLGCAGAQAQKEAEIKFDELEYDFGAFSEKEPVVSHEFKFTNVGDGPLVIHQAIASCGCTVPEYTKEPVSPGKTGTVKVTYNGEGKALGHFDKSITLRTNGTTELLRLRIKGDMKP
jgi:hypothetical protein